MSPVTVAAMFGDAELTEQWTRLLSERLTECRVVAADTVPPEEIEVLVVDNPVGSSLVTFPRLGFVQSTWAGVDRLVEGGPAVPIARMVAPEMARLMTEFVLTLVLMAHRDIPEYLRSQQAGLWRPRRSVPPSDRPVGVLGYGELGRRLALVLVEHGFPVTAWATRPRHDEVPVLAGSDGWSAILSGSEILINLLPLTADTKGILDEKAFRLMAPGSTLINVGRGAHVVEGHLIEALDQGLVSDAILDVFVDEPLPAGHVFWDHPRVTVLPHVASTPLPGDLIDDVCENISRYLDGREPKWLVSGSRVRASDR